MKHVTLPTDYCMQTYLLEGSSDGGQPMGGCLGGNNMASNTPTHGTPHVRHHPAEGREGTEGRSEC